MVSSRFKSRHGGSKMTGRFELASLIRIPHSSGLAEAEAQAEEAKDS